MKIHTNCRDIPIQDTVGLFLLKLPLDDYVIGVIFKAFFE